MNKYIKNRGQVAVEYVLLLIIVIALASVFKEVIDLGSSPDGSGASAFVDYWRTLIKEIGADVPH
ncbi:MAG: class III signal peptide-containing protein [Bdellovibrionales bacterium]|nr:class III signal peptide-containing protein [Bdellovibrionales bacterium]